jgi:peptidoglycan/LPS O-acetylase OafA/YrhL
LAKYIPQLTGIRAVAAFCVVLAHYQVWLLDRPIFAVDFGSLGMTLFFVLSGFVIHYNYGKDFEAGFGRAMLKLWIARVARLYPLYLLFLAIVVVSDKSLRPFDGETVRYITAHVLGVQSWVPLLYHGEIVSNGPFNISWSISTEFFLYLTYPAFLLIKRWPTGRVGVAIIAVSAFALYCAEGHTTSRWLVCVSPYFRIPEFFLGCLVAQAYMRGARIRHPSALACGCIAALSIFLYTGTDRGLVDRGHFALAACIAPLVFVVATGGTKLAEALSARWIVFLGEISYSIYLLHVVASRTVGGDNGVTFFLTLVILVCLAYGSFTLIEVPGKSFILRFGIALAPAHHAPR